MADGKIVIETGLDTAGLKQGLSKISGLTKTGLKATAATLAGVSAGLLAAGGAAVKTGIEFESAFAGVKKTVDATDEQLAELRTGLIDMSKEMPQSASALAEIAEAAGQLGIKTENLEGFTKTMAQLGDATNLGATEAADALARFANITGMSQTEFDRLGSTIVSLGNNMATTESEIVAMGMRLAGAGSQVGMTEAQIMSLAAALSSVGIEAEAGGSAMSTVMSKMQLAVENGGESLQNFAQVAGMSADEFKQAFKTDAAGALLSFIDGLSKCEDQGVSAIKTLDDMGISEIRQRDALLRAAGATDVFAKALDLGSEAWETNTALANEAAQRYETLESKISMAKNSASALAIAFKDSVDTNLRAAVETGTEYLDRLAEAFTDGGLEGAVDEAGDIIADLATNIAESAPGVIEAAATLIQSFIKGITKNKGSLKKAAKEIVKALADGLVDLLPPAMQKPVKKAIDAIANSFNDGGLKKAVGTVKNLFKNFGDAVADLADTVLPGLIKVLEFLAENLDTLLPGVMAVVGGITAMKVAKEVSGYIKAFKAALDLLNKSMSASPVLFLATGIGAVASALITYCATQEQAVTSTDILNEKITTHLEKLREENEALNQAEEKRREVVEGIENEYAHYQTLWGELQTIIDQNGRVKEGYEERAAFITTSLRNALGVELEYKDGVVLYNGEIIQSNSEVIDSIDSLIQKKKEEAIINAYADAYAEATRNRATAMEELATASSNLAEAEKNHADLIQRRTELARDSTLSDEAQADALGRVQGEIDKASEALENAKEAYSEANDQLSHYNTTIENYEAASGAFAAGSENVEEAITKLTAGIKSAGSATQEELEAQRDTFKRHYEALEEEARRGNANVSQSTVEEARKMFEIAQQEYEKGLQNQTEAYSYWDQEAIRYAQEHGFELQNIAQENAEGVAEKTTSTLTEKSAELMSASAEYFGQIPAGAENGIDPAVLMGIVAQACGWTQEEMAAHYGELYAIAEGYGQSGKQGFTAADMESLFGEKAQLAADTANAYIQQSYGTIASSTTGLGSAANVALTNADMPGKFGAEANAAAQSFGSSITSGSSVVPSAVGGMINAALTALTGAGLKSDAQKEGSAVPENMSTGIRSGTSGVDAAVSDLCDTAKNKLEGANLPKVSQKMGTETSGKLASGITSGKGQVATATGQTADSAKSTLQGANLPGHSYNQGGQFSSGLAGGILSGRSDVISAAISVARSAWQASQRELEIHSPSRKTKYQGRMYDAGIEAGILDDKDKVIQAGERVSRDLLKTLDLPSAYAQMRAAMGANTVRVSGAYRIPKAVPAGEHAGFTREELKAIGETIGDVVNGRIEQMRFVFRERELGRMIREVQTV